MVLGQELLTAELAVRAIRDSALARGIDEHHVVYLGKKINPYELSDMLDSRSLFATQKLVEVRFDSEKPNAKEAGKLLDVIGHVGTNVLIFQCVTLENRTQKAAWINKLSEACVLTVQAPKVYFNRLPDWIAQRAQAKQVNLPSDATQKIAEYTQGNLMWAEQLLSQLASVSADEIDTLLERILDDQSRYGVFELCDAVLAGNPKALHILERLFAENEPPTLIASMLNRDLQILLAMSDQPAADVFKQHRIWQSKQALYQRAQNRLTDDAITQALKTLATIDRLNKGAGFGNAELAFADYIGLMIGKEG